MAQKSRLDTVATGRAAWSKMFPPAVDTVSQSCALMKKLVAVSVSSISYARKFFPEEAYANKSLEKLPLKILKERNNVKEARKLAAYLVGAFEAIEKKYLKELIMCLYEDSEELKSTLTASEVYRFLLSYPDSGVMCSVGLQGKKAHTISMDDVKEATQSLLHNLIEITQGLPPIPDTAQLTVRLTYY